MALVRSFKIILLVGLAALLTVLAFSFSAGMRPSARDAEPAAPSPSLGDAVVQHGARVRIDRTRRGAPSLRLHAATSRTHASGALELEQVSIMLFGPQAEPTRIECPLASSQPPSAVPARQPGQPGGGGFAPSLRDGAGSWHLEGGVSVTGSGDLRLNAPSLDYDEASGIARTAEPVSFSRGPALGSALGMEMDISAQSVHFLQDVTASMALGGMGKVSLRAAAASYAMRDREFEMRDYRAETARGEVLAGRRLVAVFLEQGGLDRLEGDDGFELTITHSAPIAGSSPLSKLLALEGRRTMTGQSLAIRFDEKDRPAVIEVSGQASVTAGEGDAAGSSSLGAETLVFDLIGGGLTRARASGDVALRRAPASAGGTGFRMNSENLDASFDPNAGELLAVSGEGEIRLWDQGIESQGSRTFLDPDSDVMTIVGESDAPARVTWTGRVIEARRIEVNRKLETLTARDGVRASYTPEKSAEPSSATPDPLPFFKGGETIHAIANVLTVSDDGRTARYEGQVRLWQGDSRLEAGQVDIHESDGVLTAGGDVTSTWRQEGARPADAPRTPGDDIVTVSAAAMSYRRRDDRVDYTGHVLVTQGFTRVTSDTLAIHLRPGGEAADRMEAAGRVEVRDRGRVGRGDRLLAEVGSGLLKLMGTGREAIVQDESTQQVVRGSSLTMDRTGDRILVESELGGRTWITLKPRQKGAPGVGSDPNN